MPRARRLTLLTALAALLLPALLARPAQADPATGDVFREYRMATQMWRVGQRHEWGGANWGVNLPLRPTRHEQAPAYEVDLDGAVRAEVQVGYDQCHGGTTGLAIAFNDHEYLRLPVPDTIPEPKAGYMFRPFPTINVPLEHLRSGENQFKFRIDAEPREPGDEGWYQNLVYNVVLRVYYDESKPHPTGEITSPASDSEIGRTATIAARVEPAESPIAKVEFIGFYEDFDRDGDGIYREYQRAYDDDPACSVVGIIGLAEQSPWQVAWDTSWLPDQKGPMHIAALVSDESGMTYMTPEARNVRLVRPNLSVEMCPPYNVPSGWVTRKGRMEANFDVTGDPAKATAAKMLFHAWGGNDGAGGWVNETEIPHFKSGKPVPVEALRQGQNTIANAKGGHHGLEICWPGPVVLIQYETEGEE
ncbi:MAG: hypothetical protein ACLFV3_10150 [Phycisphaeraceae bacterium]